MAGYLRLMEKPAVEGGYAQRLDIEKALRWLARDNDS